MRAKLLQNPRDAEIAVRLARSYYNLVSEEGDPRYLGYAQAALAPWWTLHEPPREVRVLRASLLQFRHDFDGAMADLNQILEHNPRHPQARSLRAIIHIIQARYSQAQSDCQAMRGVASDLIANGCEAMVKGLTGQASNAYQILNNALQQYPNASTEEKLWVSIRLAEIAQRLNQPALAEIHFKQGLALRVVNTFLLGAYADFLLDQHRPAEVVTLLKDKTRSDSLLLRLVLAERALQLPTAKEREASLAARYAAAQLRGDKVHQQEEAQFALQVQHDPQKALLLAQENWKVQREPRDARVFLDAALALKDAQASQPVMKWLEDNHIEDAHLHQLARQLKGIR